MKIFITLIISCYIIASPLRAQDAYQYASDAMDMAAQGNLELAVSLFSKSISAEPTAAAYFNRGTVKIRLEDFYGAIQDFNNAIDLSAENSSYYLNRGVAKHKIEDFRGAILDFNEAIRIYPNNHKAFLSRGICRTDMEDYEKAKIDLNKCIEISPKFEEAFFYRADLYNKMGEREAACADWAQAADLGKSYASQMIKIYCE